MVEFSPYVAVDVDDVEAARSFYRETLGMDTVDDPAGETALACGEMTFYLQESDEGRTFFEFTVDDLERTREELSAAGCELHETETPEGETSYLVTDPYGLRYHVFER